MGKELSSTINEVLFVRFRSSWFLSAALVAFLFTYLIYPGKECGGTPGQLAFIFIFASLVDTIHASFAQGRRKNKIEKEKIKKEIEEQKSFYSEIFSDDEVRNITEKLLGNGNKPITCSQDTFGKLYNNGYIFGNEDIFDNHAIFNYTVNGHTHKVFLDNDAYDEIKKLYPKPVFKSSNRQNPRKEQKCNEHNPH